MYDSLAAYIIIEAPIMGSLDIFLSLSVFGETQFTEFAQFCPDERMHILPSPSPPCRAYDVADIISIYQIIVSHGS